MNAYLDALVEVLRAGLPDRLAAVLLVGSAATGDFREETSDLDVLVAVDRPLGDQVPLVADWLDRELPPPPARKLELVVYTLRNLEEPSPWRPFELNYNSDTPVPDESSHWFLLDLAAARERSRPLLGPPGDELVGPIPRHVLIEAVERSLDWYSRFEPATANAVLGACRAWLFAAEGRWASKGEAAGWASARSAHPETIAAADRARTAEVDPEAVAAVVAEARSALALEQG